MDKAELDRLKTRIDGAKTEISKMEGALEQFKQVWKDDWNCENKAEVEKLITDTQEKIDALKQKAKKYEDDIQAVLDKIEE